METSSVYKAEDVSRILDVEISTAYKIIQSLNNELKKIGCYTVSGRISKSYFDEKYCIRKAPAGTSA